jgi:tripartite-type tricarboxylate transporter receptor subunit TctC
MTGHRIKLFISAALASLCLASAQQAWAQTENFPNKPIKIIVPFTAGGVVDSIARLLAEKMSARYGQPVVVENRVGAGGSIGTDLVAKSAPDGYTLLLVSPGHAVAPTLNKGVNWDPVRDFRAIQGLGVIPNAIVVHPDVPAKTMAEFIELARKSTQPLTYASAGIGTSNHLSGELLAQNAGIKLSHVPYKGQPDALNDLFAGRVSMMPLTVALANSHAKTGKIRALAVTTSKRSTAMPQLPTVAEAANLPAYEVGTWFGLVAPAKVPTPIIQKMAKDVAEFLTMPDVKARLDTLGMELAPQNPAEFDTFVAREFEKWSQVIKKAGIESQ